MSAATRHKHTNDACLANVLPYRALTDFIERFQGQLCGKMQGGRNRKGDEKTGKGVKNTPK